jgi:hypothetical protein
MEWFFGSRYDYNLTVWEEEDLLDLRSEQSNNDNMMSKLDPSVLMICPEFPIYSR